VHVDNTLHGHAIGEVNKVEETATQKGIWQLFFVVTGNNHDWTLYALIVSPVS